VAGVQISYRLPTHRVELGDVFLSPGVIGDLASAAEAVGFGAVFTTDHPFPGDTWLAHGGHHALDPLVALSFAAAATSRIRLHTNLFVLAYRNPFMAAKGVATLDVLSGGRVTLGIGSGYLEGEFTALGASFADRNDNTDDAIKAMKAAWTGESVTWTGASFEATGNTMLPTPRQLPHPPIWVGGNSRRAIRRAVELADGWCPFPNPPRSGQVHQDRGTGDPIRPGPRAGVRQRVRRVDRTDPTPHGGVRSGCPLELRCWRRRR